MPSVTWSRAHTGALFEPCSRLPAYVMYCGQVGDWARVQDNVGIVDYRKQALDMMHAGQIKAMVDPREFRGLESVPDAIEYMLSGQSVGKVVVAL